MLPEATVFVVDDDAGMRDSLRWLLESVSLRVETFPTAEEFLQAYTPSRSGCR
jgi:two-component system response regulator FixJ